MAPSPSRTSFRKKSPVTRFPMNRPCWSGKTMRIVSMSPALMRPSISFGSSLPFCMARSSSVGWARRRPSRRRADLLLPLAAGRFRSRRGLDLLDVRLAVSLFLGVAVLPPGHGEFLLGGENQTVPSGDAEVQDAEDEPDRRPDDARAVALRQIERDQREQGDHAG